MINIIYAALSIRGQTEKTTFSCKDDCTLTQHTGRWTYSPLDFEIPLCHIPPFNTFLLNSSINPFCQLYHDFKDWTIFDHVMREILTNCCETCIAFRWTSSVLDSSVWFQKSVFFFFIFYFYSYHFSCFTWTVSWTSWTAWSTQSTSLKKLHLSLISYKSSCKYQTISYKVLLELFFITQPFRMVVSFFCQAQPSPSPSWAE